jgi:hypothetical protein
MKFTPGRPQGTTPTIPRNALSGAIVHRRLAVASSDIALVLAFATDIIK